MLVELEKIEKAKEKIGAARTAEIAADLLQLEKFDAKNFKACCPFHNEDTPSFILNQKTLKFKCFGCGRIVDLIDIYMHTGMTYMEAVQALFDEAGMQCSFGELGVKTRSEYRYPHPDDCGTRDAVNAYMQQRGISAQTLDYAGVTQDAKGNIVFNYYDTNDVLCMCKYRPSHKIDKSKGENKNWCQVNADTMPLLFNMNKINTSQPLIVTEGECFPGDAEVLTPNGWVRLDEYNGEKVLQITPDLTGEFVTPNAYIKHEYNGDLYIDRKNNYTSITTANHNIVYYDYNGRLQKRKACEMPNIGTGYIPTAVNVDGTGIPLSNDQIALYLAVSADCTIDLRKNGGRYTIIMVKKERKYNRLKSILDRLGIAYFDNPCVGNGYKYIGFSTPSFIKDKRLPFEWIEQATIEQRRFIIEEMVHWDGNKVLNRNQYEYSSKELDNATVMQTLAHTAGYMSTIIHRRNKYGEWYKVSILLNKHSVSHQHPYQTEHYEGMVYCVSVPTGMILVRQEQHITITGNCDALAAIESGFTNAVSVPFGSQNFQWIEHNWEWLEQFTTIIICSDNDEAGVKMRKEVVPRLGSWRTRYVEIPHTYHDPNTDKDIPIKDLNEVLYYMGKSAVANLINNAEDPGVPSIVNISEIQDVDLDEMDGISTGIRELDAEIMRLFYGTLTVVSGLPGAGKTSFLSQLVCQSLEQDKPAWMFSREMPGWMEKSWLNYIMAGGHHVKAYEDRSGAKYYKVTIDAKNKINEHYNNKWFLYRDDWSNKLDDLLISMEDSVRKYGTKLLILDNLMTIDLDSNENSELLKQTECINKLIRFAMKYSVAVVLVAHPRKMPKGEEVGIYDISGTSNIINLAHRTIGLRRIDKEREKSNHDVCLTLIKDRMRGKAGKRINMYYDIPTRRFYTNESEYDYQYSWDDGNYPPLPYPHLEEREVYGEC